MKTTFRLADFSTANTNIIVILTLAALLAAMISYPVALALALDKKENKKTNPSFQRAAIVISICANQFIEYLSGDGCFNALKNLTQALRRQAHELIDPNYNRRRSSLTIATELEGATR